MLDKDTELYLEIDDDYKRVQFFDTSVNYCADCEDDMTNHVRVSIFAGDKTIAFLECVVFYDAVIAESRYDHIYLADGMVQDAYEAMELLKECSLLTVTDENRTLGELLTSYPFATVYLHHIAVRNDFRNKGIGNWLLRNLPRVLERNYSIFPRLIITLLSPQDISWNTPTPGFCKPDVEKEEHKKMSKAMERLFEKNGYEQFNNTGYYIAR